MSARFRAARVWLTLASVMGLELFAASPAGAQQDLEPRVRVLETARRKADQEAVDRALQAKADSSRIETSLSAKADKAELSTTREEQATFRRQVDAGFGDIHDKLLVQGLNINRFWVLLAALLVFFMQAGFKCLEVGLVGNQFGTLQAAYKLAAWIAALLGYYVGFGLMFSASSQFLGIPNGGGECWPCSPMTVIEQINCSLDHAGNKICKTLDETDRGMEFFLFQLAFAATAVTIPAGAIAQRMSVAGYFVMGLVISAFVYPLFGHWAWGGGAHVVASEQVQGWLRLRGFHDFAGSAVVHTVGGCFALMAALFLGKRSERTPPFNRGYAFLGVFLLWFGWWGFNGGSTLVYDNRNTVPNIILNTNIAGASAGLAACLFAWLMEWGPLNDWLTGKKRWILRAGNIPEKTLGGALGGLVAITASCDVATPGFALVVGVMAAVVHNMAFDLLQDLEIDDPAGAVPVHAACGVAGTLLVAFAPLLKAKEGTLRIQAIGAGVAIGFSVVAAVLCLWILRRLGILTLGRREKRAWIG